MINEENYEAYFLDYHEGNLQPQDVAALFLFLENHPDLKKSFESFESFTIKPDSGADFPDKGLLKKKETTTDDISTLLISALEGNLTADEALVLDTLLKENVSYQADKQLYAKTKLQADVATYPNKAPLKSDSIEKTILNKWLIAQVEGDLNPEALKQLHKTLAANADLRSHQHLYAKTKLQAGNETYPNKTKLKRTAAWGHNNQVRWVVAAAAVLILFVSYFVYTDLTLKQAPQPLANTHDTLPANTDTNTIHLNTNATLASIDSVAQTSSNITAAETTVKALPPQANKNKQKPTHQNQKLPQHNNQLIKPMVQEPLVAEKHDTPKPTTQPAVASQSNKTVIIRQPNFNPTQANSTNPQSITDVAVNKVQQVTGASLTSNAGSKKWQVLSWAINRMGGKKVKMETGLDADDQVSNVNIKGSKFSIEHTRGY